MNENIELMMPIKATSYDHQKVQNGTTSEFDGSLWGSMVEFITVGRDKEITVTFRNGDTGITDTQKRMALGCGRVSFFVMRLKRQWKCGIKNCSISAIIVTELWKESLC